MRDGLLGRIARGAAAGALGTIAIQAAMKTQQKALPAASAPLRDDPGHFMVEKAEALLPESRRERIPAKVENAAIKSLPFGYGMMFGALYAAVRARPRNAVAEGALLGLATWAAGYLGWLPATGLLPKPTGQSAAQFTGPIATHAVYGIATVAAYQRMV